MRCDLPSAAATASINGQTWASSAEQDGTSLCGQQYSHWSTAGYNCKGNTASCISTVRSDLACTTGTVIQKGLCLSVPCLIALSVGFTWCAVSAAIRGCWFQPEMTFATSGRVSPQASSACRTPAGHSTVTVGSAHTSTLTLLQLLEHLSGKLLVLGQLC